MARLLALVPRPNLLVPKSVYVRTYQRRRLGRVETVRCHFRRPPVGPVLH
jgi:hypothetical protein